MQIVRHTCKAVTETIKKRISDIRSAISRQLYRKMLLSYVAVLIFSIFAVIGVFAYSGSMLKETTAKTGKIPLQQVSESLERISDDLQQVANSLRFRSEYRSLVSAEEELTSYKILNIAKLKSEMNNQIVNDNYVSEMFIWFSSPELGVSTYGMSRGVEDTDKSLADNFRLQLNQIIDWTEEEEKLSVHVIGKGQWAESAFAVSRGSYFGSDITSIIVMKLDMSALYEILRSSDETPALFWAVSNENAVILANEADKALISDTTWESSKENAVTRLYFNGIDYAVMKYDSGNDFKIYYAREYGEYRAAMNQYYGIVAIFLVAFLMSGGILCASISVRTYTPIKRLSEKLLKDKHADSKDELESLENSINHLLYSSSEYRLLLTKEQRRTQADFLVSLLYGNSEIDDFGAACKELGLALEGEAHAVIGVSVGEDGNLFFDGGFAGNRSLALFSVSSVLEELLEEYCNAALCICEEKVYAVITPRNSEDYVEVARFHERLCRICTEADAFLKEKLNISASMYVSRLFKTEETDGMNIHRAYREVCWGLGEIISYDISAPVSDFKSIDLCIQSIGEMFSGMADSITTERQKILDAAVSGDIDLAERLYIKERGMELACSDHSFATVRAHALMLLGHFSTLLPAQVLYVHELEMKKWRDLLRQTERDKELKEMMCSVFLFFHQILANEESEENVSKKKGDMLALKATTYISSNYADESLNVSQVAEYLNVSSSYLSRLYQRAYGISILDQIHKYRIKAAEDLLRDSERTVADIACAVGYSSALTFLRAFKRYNNCTPTEYRETTGR